MDQIKEEFLTDNLTMEECSCIAKNACGPDATVLKYDLRLNCEGVCGFMAEYFVLYLTVKMGDEEARVHRFFVKSLPTRNRKFRDFINQTGFFKKEIKLYKELFPRLKKFEISPWHPQAYHIRDDLIVLENLCPQFEHIPNPKTSLTWDNIRSALYCLASVHTNSIRYETSTGLYLSEDFPILQEECLLKREDPWLRTTLKGIHCMAKNHPRLQEKYREFVENDFENAIEVIYELIKPSNKFINVLCHRDSWEKNIFYATKDTNNGISPKKSLLIDFQFCCYAPPALDVLFYLHLNTTKKYRKDKLRACLQFYYRTFTQLLEKVGMDANNSMTWEEFIESCEYIKLVPLTTACIYIPSMKSLNKLMELKHTDPDLYNFYMKVDRYEFIKKCMETDAIFKEYMLENIEELVECLYERFNKNLVQ